MEDPNRYDKGGDLMMTLQSTPTLGAGKKPHAPLVTPRRPHKRASSRQRHLRDPWGDSPEGEDNKGATEEAG